MSGLQEIKARVEGHTEGPWHIETDSELDYEQGIPFSEWPSVLVGPENADPSGWAKKHGETRRISEIAELCMADAELIAAAPKMLNALNRMEALAILAESTLAYGTGGVLMADALRAQIQEALA